MREDTYLVNILLGLARERALEMISDTLASEDYKKTWRLYLADVNAEIARRIPQWVVNEEVTLRYHREVMTVIDVA